MARGHIHCPRCDRIAAAKVVDWTVGSSFYKDENLSMGNRVWSETEPVIHGYRRVRDCESWHSFATVEVPEELIEELITLRRAVKAALGRAERVAAEAAQLRRELENRP